ncbi:protein transport protein SEC31 [Nematocida ausubeli]|nr:protein transport protein SEC31 [Nematocida ausubeli]
MKIETTSLVSFSPVGSLAALGTKAKILNSDFSSDSVLHIRNTETDETIFTKVVPSRFNRLEWGMYGDKVFVAGGLDAGNVTILDATCLLSDEKAEPRELVFKNHVKTDDDILGIDFAGAMPVLTTGSYSGKIMLWNLRTLDKPMAPGITTKFEGISCLQWNKNMPQILAVGTTDGMVSILDLRGKSEVTRIGDAYFSKSEITSLQWDPNPNSAQLAVSSSAHSSVILYDLRISRGTPRLEGHSEGILNCKWSRHDPSLIVTCGRDNSVIAWDANTYKKRGVMVEDSVFDFAFSPENPDMIAYSSYNGYVVMDTLTSLNARSPFLDKIPEWQKQGAGMCFTSQGIFVSEEKGPRLRKWVSDVNKNSYEWKVLDAYEKEHPRREIMKILNSTGEKSPILEQAKEEEEGEDEKKSDESSLKIDEEDPITEKLIQGNFSSAFSLALAENAHLAALIALCDGPNVLKREKERILKAPGASSSFLLVLSILSGDYSGLIKNNVDWTVIVKILGSHCADEEFIPKVRAVAECLEKKDPDSAKICYLIARDVQKYQEIEERKTEKPKTIFEAVQFFKNFDKVFAVVERGALLMNQKISIDENTIEYLKHLMDRGEKKRVLSFIKSLNPKSAQAAEEELNLPSTSAPGRTQNANVHQQVNSMNIHQRTPQPFAGQGQPKPNPYTPHAPMPQKPNTMPSASPFAAGPATSNLYSRDAGAAPFPPQAQKQSAPQHEQPQSFFSQPRMAMPGMTPGYTANPANHQQNTVSAVPAPNIGGRTGPKVSFAKPQMPESPLNRVAAQSYHNMPGPAYHNTPANGPAMPNMPMGSQSIPNRPTMPNMPARPSMPMQQPMQNMPTSSQSTPMPNMPARPSMPNMPMQQPMSGQNMQNMPGRPAMPNMPMQQPMSGQNMPMRTSPLRQPEFQFGAGGSQTPSHGSGEVPRMPYMPSSAVNTPGMQGGMGTPMKPAFTPMSDRVGTPYPDAPQEYARPGMNHHNPFPGMGHSARAQQQKQPELVVTPEMEKTYADLSKLIDFLLGMIHNKKGALKGWLLKSIDPKIVILRKHLSEKKWSSNFLTRMDGFLHKISEMGISEGSSVPVSAEQLDAIRKEGDAICATRPYGTEIEIWMPAIYSLLKVALH